METNLNEIEGDSLQNLQVEEEISVEILGNFHCLNVQKEYKGNGGGRVAQAGNIEADSIIYGKMKQKSLF